LSEAPDSEPRSGLGLHVLARQLVLGYTEGFGAAQVAAFVAGWQAALELLSRTDVTMPSATEDLRRAIARLVTELDSATRAALEDAEDESAAT
jgi:hypothetical protein